jgi:hypothetical protein
MSSSNRWHAEKFRSAGRVTLSGFAIVADLSAGRFGRCASQTGRRRQAESGHAVLAPGVTSTGVESAGYGINLR